MNARGRRGAGAAVVLLLLAVLGGGTAAAAPGEACDLRLTVELTPDVPDASEAGFLSSLLNNHPAYHLELLRQDGPSLIELGLSGPGPGYLCLSVIETMRRDGRVLSVRINPDETPTASVVITPPQEKSSGVHVSSTGLGSLYWAARHPREAWRVLLPIRAGQKPGDEALEETDPSAADAAPLTEASSVRSARFVRPPAQPAPVAWQPPADSSGRGIHPDGFNLTSEYLGVRYSNNLVLLQTTLKQGRTVELKKAVYRRVADDLPR